MLRNDSPENEVKNLVFLTLAKCGHVLELIERAQAGEDIRVLPEGKAQPGSGIPRIVGQLKMIEDQTRDIQRKMVSYRIYDSEVEHKLEAIITVTRYDIKPGLNKLKFNAAYATSKALIDEWGPRIDTILSIIEKSINIVKASKKRD
ncbi:MAG TPA: hypothetical protein VKV37_03485 [Ktedonobacteraceae bacterium]|nr:hypothetical protein [Ktedonobacteraceae bacterium]